MIGNFGACLRLTEDYEGGNDDYDGFHTSRGITQADYDAWQTLHDGVKGDVYDAPQRIIDSIYLNDYWHPYCDQLAKGLDFMYFDTNVNEGGRKAVLFLQRALKIPADGHFGIRTIAACKVECATPAGTRSLIVAMDAERRAHYEILAKKVKFRKDLKGWLERAAKCQAAALRMVT
jgi:lysozyme family protein